MSDVSLLGSYGGAGGAGLMFRNKLINGNFDIWQRGTSQTDSSYGSDDRWRNETNGGSKTHSQQAFALGQTDVPGSPKYFSRTVFVGGTSAINYVGKIQKVESVETLAGKKATLSFWAKADASKNIAVEFEQNFGTGGTPSSTVTSIGSQKVALTSSWQKFEISVDIPSVAGKTLGTDGNDFLGCRFWFSAGSNWDVRTDSLGVQDGTFDIAQVQLEEGPVATPFEHRPIGIELSLCQRYFWKYVPTGTYDIIATATEGSTAGVVEGLYYLPTAMRLRNPTITYSGLRAVDVAQSSASLTSASGIGYNAIQFKSSRATAAQITGNGSGIVLEADAEL